MPAIAAKTGQWAGNARGRWNLGLVDHPSTIATARITELAEELGHSPQMTLNTYAHVIDELRGAPRLPAELEIARARQAVAERGLDSVDEDAVG